jgi:hypothetical protein
MYKYSTHHTEDLLSPKLPPFILDGYVNIRSIIFIVYTCFWTQKFIIKCLIIIKLQEITEKV